MKETNVKIYNPEGKGWLGTKYEVDGKEIEGVNSVDFHVAINEIPVFTFNTMGIPDIDMQGDVNFNFSPKTVEEAAKVICHEIKHDEEFKKAFTASVESVLARKAGIGPHAFLIAEDVVNGIFGMEIFKPRNSAKDRAAEWEKKVEEMAKDLKTHD